MSDLSSALSDFFSTLMGSPLVSPAAGRLYMALLVILMTLQMVSRIRNERSLDELKAQASSKFLRVILELISFLERNSWARLLQALTMLIIMPLYLMSSVERQGLTVSIDFGLFLSILVLSMSLLSILLATAFVPKKVLFSVGSAIAFLMAALAFELVVVTIDFIETAPN